MTKHAKHGESDMDSICEHLSNNTQVRNFASACEPLESIVSGTNEMEDLDQEDSLSLKFDSEPTAYFGESCSSSGSFESGSRRMSLAFVPDSIFKFPDSIFSSWNNESIQSSSLDFAMGNEKNAVTVWSEIPASDGHLTAAESAPSPYIYGFFLN